MTSRLVNLIRPFAGDALHWARALKAELGAVVAGDRRAAKFAEYGAGSVIVYPPGPMFGQHHMALGARTLIGPNVSLVVGMSPDEPMHTRDADGVALRLGDRVTIGRGSSIAARWSVVIEDDVMTGPDVYITDHDHAYGDLDVPIGLQWPTCAAVRIGAGSWLGTGVVVLPGADIGRHVVVAASSVVRGHIPDNCVIAGVPAKVVRHHDGTDWVPPLSVPVEGTPQPPSWPV